MESYNAQFTENIIFIIVFFASLLVMIFISNKEYITKTDTFVFLLAVAVFVLNIVRIFL